MMMKRWLTLAACLASPALLAAPGPQDFAYSAPIHAAPDAAWVRMELPPQAQAQLQTTDGRDVQVFNAQGTARHAVDAILEAGSYDLGPKTGRIESPDEWTEEKIRARAAALCTDKGPEGDFSD